MNAQINNLLKKEETLRKNIVQTRQRKGIVRFYNKLNI